MNNEQILADVINGLSTRVNALADKLGYDINKHEKVGKELLIDRLTKEVLAIEETVGFIQEQIYKLEK